jgi:hypothetical protein
MKTMSDVNIKSYSAEIYTICNSLWPDEFQGKYIGTMEDFRDWLNTKTALDENHIPYDQREAALKAWLDVLQSMEAGV